jgi:hypothetical protein
LNPARQRILERIEALPADLRPLRDACLRHLERPSEIDGQGEISIGPQPWIAPRAFAIRIFPPAEPSWFQRYRQLHGILVPTVLEPLLCSANGWHFFGFSAYGMAPSMLSTPPGLDRSRVQCLDLSLANQDWKTEFDAPADSFHFGSRSISKTEIGGFFLLPDGAVSLLRDTGLLVNSWSSILECLADELPRAEADGLANAPAGW